MSQHPLNLALRFALELGLLASLGYWAWHLDGLLFRWTLVVVMPLAAAVLWGVFRVPGDPGKAPIAVAGPLRLAIELFLFVCAVWCLFDAGALRMAWGGMVITLLHYILSYDRVLWLLGFTER